MRRTLFSLPCSCSVYLKYTRNKGNAVLPSSAFLPCCGVEESADEFPEVPEVGVTKDEALRLPAATGVDVHLSKVQ